MRGLAPAPFTHSSPVIERVRSTFEARPLVLLLHSASPRVYRHPCTILIYHHHHRSWSHFRRHHWTFHSVLSDLFRFSFLLGPHTVFFLLLKHLRWWIYPKPFRRRRRLCLPLVRLLLVSLLYGARVLLSFRIGDGISAWLVWARPLLARRLMQGGGNGWAGLECWLVDG